MNIVKIRIGITLLLVLAVTNVLAAHPINDYYKAHKNDHKMEAKIVPPKVAAKMVDEDYPEAIEMLKAMTALRYLNYWGDQQKIKLYAKQAISAKGNYPLLLEKSEGNRSIAVFGLKKKGLIRRLFAVVQTKTQFILMIGRGKLTQKQLNWLPSLSKEIQ
ncbi:MAG: DUF4252 domain-containing protein [Putridiphycobacter sp.]|nr:DUF4252 domain-containing protein [Putridiphycobacter sp.]